MSDMSSQRITFRVPRSLGDRLKKHAEIKGRPESELVRDALASYLDADPVFKSAYELARDAGLIGCVQTAPRDLSTNPRHFKGFGKNR